MSNATTWYNTLGAKEQQKELRLSSTSKTYQNVKGRKPPVIYLRKIGNALSIFGWTTAVIFSLDILLNGGRLIGLLLAKY